MAKRKFDEKTELTVPMDKQLEEAMVSELEYGDTKAGWIRQAIRERLDREDGELPERDVETDGGQTCLAD